MESPQQPSADAADLEKMPSLDSFQPKPRKIIGQLLKVMAEVRAIEKKHRNAQQSYNFRGIDDIYNELHPLMAEHGIICVPRVVKDRSEERTTSKGNVLIYRVLHVEYDFFADDESSISALGIGEAMDSGDKASNKAMSAAHKYVLMQMFCLPTQDKKDVERDDHEVLPKNAAPAKDAPPPAVEMTGETVFDATNDDHLSFLSRILIKNSVPKEFWDDIAVNLNGKPVKLAGEIYRELKAKGAANG